MSPEEQETETKMRDISGNLTRAEGLVMLNLMLERSTTDEVAEAIKLAKLSGEVNQICHKISSF